MSTALESVLILAGSIVALLSGIGLVRFPDLFTRMHAAGKVGVFGSMLILLGAAIHFSDAGVSARCVAVIVLIFVTTPMPTHWIAKAAYRKGVPLWEETVADDLARPPRVEHEDS